MILDHYLTELLGKSISQTSSLDSFNKFFANSELEEISGDYYYTNPEQGIGVVYNSDKILENIHFYSGRGENSRFSENYQLL